MSVPGFSIVPASAGTESHTTLTLMNAPVSGCRGLGTFYASIFKNLEAGPKLHFNGVFPKL